MRKLILILLAWLSGLAAVWAQDYKTGIGVRLAGYSSGITVRGFTGSGTALEGLVGFGHKSFLLTALYEKFKPVNGAAGLNWFYGGGLHLGYFRAGGAYYIYKNNESHVYVLRDGNPRWVPGIDFILGLDYKFANAPLNIGLDIKPFMDIIDGTELYFDGALSFRFVF